jgi:nicotinate-nucleotide adenylyltransferase
MRKIGVFGGSFDPVHYGHLFLARQALCECGLERIIVVPTGMQPFKLDKPVTPALHRFNMVKLAFKNDERISVSDIETGKGEVSYTIDTLREIKRSCGDGAEISFILGADTFLKIEKWKNPYDLLREFSFIVGVRPGYEDNELNGFIERLVKTHDIDAVKIQNKQIPVSSSELKEMIRSGKSCGCLIPLEVERYIDANGLYR